MSFELCSRLIPYANARWNLEVADLSTGLETHSKFCRIEMSTSKGHVCLLYWEGFFV